MRSRDTRRFAKATAIRSMILLAMVACAQEVAAPPEADLAARFAKSSPTSTVKVTASAPDSGVQSSTLDVVITGSGFEPDMVARWALKGVADSTQIRTNSTRFVSSRQLVANITINGTATLAKWDIQVMNKGKGGIGTELFTVQAPESIWKLPESNTGLGVVSDGRQVVDGLSVYEAGTCGLVGKIYIGGSGDATLQTDNPREKHNICGTPRMMSIVYPVGDAVYPSGGVETSTVFLNLRNISNAATSIGIGYANRVERVFSIKPANQPRCATLRWATVSADGLPAPGDNVWVERIDGTTYHVYTKDRGPDPQPGVNRATCTTTGQSHHLSVDLYVVAKNSIY